MREATKTESKDHILGKELAKNMLKERGFYNVEIKEEYCFKYKKWKKIIDVVGIKRKFNSKSKKWEDIFKVAIEVGNVDIKDLAKLELFFDEVHNFKKPTKLSVKESYNIFIRLFDENKMLKEELEIEKNSSLCWLNKYSELCQETKIYDPDIFCGCY